MFTRNIEKQSVENESSLNELKTIRKMKKTIPMINIVIAFAMMSSLGI